MLKHLRQRKTKETENIIDINPIIKDEIPPANSPLLCWLIGVGFV